MVTNSPVIRFGEIILDPDNWDVYILCCNKCHKAFSSLMEFNKHIKRCFDNNSLFKLNTKLTYKLSTGQKYLNVDPNNEENEKNLIVYNPSDVLEENEDINTEIPTFPVKIKAEFSGERWNKMNQNTSTLSIENILAEADCAPERTDLVSCIESVFKRPAPISISKEKYLKYSKNNNTSNMISSKVNESEIIIRKSSRTKTTKSTDSLAQNQNMVMVSIGKKGCNALSGSPCNSATVVIIPTKGNGITYKQKSNLPLGNIQLKEQSVSTKVEQPTEVILQKLQGVSGLEVKRTSSCNQLKKSNETAAILNKLKAKGMQIKVCEKKNIKNKCETNFKIKKYAIPLASSTPKPTDILIKSSKALTPILPVQTKTATTILPHGIDTPRTYLNKVAKGRVNKNLIIKKIKKS